MIILMFFKFGRSRFKYPLSPIDLLVLHVLHEAHLIGVDLSAVDVFNRLHKMEVIIYDKPSGSPLNRISKALTELVSLGLAEEVRERRGGRPKYRISNKGHLIYHLLVGDLTTKLGMQIPKIEVPKYSIIYSTCCYERYSPHKLRSDLSSLIDEVINSVCSELLNQNPEYKDLIEYVGEDLIKDTIRGFILSDVELRLDTLKSLNKVYIPVTDLSYMIFASLNTLARSKENALNKLMSKFTLKLERKVISKIPNNILKNLVNTIWRRSIKRIRDEYCSRYCSLTIDLGTSTYTIRPDLTFTAQGPIISYLFRELMAVNISNTFIHVLSKELVNELRKEYSDIPERIPLNKFISYISKTLKILSKDYVRWYIKNILEKFINLNECSKDCIDLFNGLLNELFSKQTIKKFLRFPRTGGYVEIFNNVCTIYGLVSGLIRYLDSKDVNRLNVKEFKCLINALSIIIDSYAHNLSMILGAFDLQEPLSRLGYIKSGCDVKLSKVIKKVAENDRTLYFPSVYCSESWRIVSLKRLNHILTAVLSKYDIIDLFDYFIDPINYIILINKAGFIAREGNLAERLAKNENITEELRILRKALKAILLVSKYICVNRTYILKIMKLVNHPVLMEVFDEVPSCSVTWIT